MPKLRCQCGEVIKDVSDNLPYKARYIRDQDMDFIINSYTDEIESFIQAIKDGNRNKWVRKKFPDPYPLNIPDSAVIFDIISSYESQHESDMYQCEHCGRVLIQLGRSNHYSFFYPDDENYRNVFKGISKS